MNADALAFLAGKGFTVEEIVEFARLAERKKDPSNAERQARYRANRKERKVTRYSNGVTPLKERDQNPSPDTISDEIDPEMKRVRAAPTTRTDFPKPDWADPGIWRDFLANRKTKKLPNTATAHKGFLEDIARLSDDHWPPGRLLEAATRKGHGAIYPSLKADDHGTRNGTPVGMGGHRGGGGPRAPADDGFITGLRRLQGSGCADDRGGMPRAAGMGTIDADCGRAGSVG